MNLPSLEHDVVLGGFHHVGGELLALGDDLVGGHAAARCRRATIEREPKVPVPIATWSVSPYWKRTRSGGMPSLSAMIWRNAVLVALAVVVRAHRDGERAGRIEAQLGVLDQAGIGRLDRVGDADAAQLAALRAIRARRASKPA